jgi:hypothetical protein
MFVMKIPIVFMESIARGQDYKIYSFILPTILSLSRIKGGEK